jgi:hypothetical protein
MMVIQLEYVYELRIIPLTKLAFLMMVTLQRSRSRIRKTELEIFPVLGSKRGGTL